MFRLFSSRNFCLLFVAGILFFSLPPSSIAQQQWKMATSWPGGPFFDDCAKAFAEKVEFLTEGRLQIRVFQGGVLGDPLSVSDTVKNAAAEMGNTASGYDWGKDKTGLLFLGYAGAGDAQWLLHWLYQGGGAELWRKWRQEEFNLVAFPLCVYPTEVFLHSRKPIRTLSDLKGVKFRSAGVWLEIAKGLGASPISAAGGDIYPMLERGVIDATEWATPWHNTIAGFHKAAKYVIIPGVHQPSTAEELLINKKAWDTLSPRDQRLVEYAARLTTIDFWFKSNKEDALAIAKFKENDNEIIELDKEVILAAKRLGLAWAEAEAKKDSRFKEVLQSQQKFQRLWQQGSRFREIPNIE